MTLKLPKASMSTSTKTVNNRWKPLKTVVTRWIEVYTYTKEVNQAQPTSLQHFSTLFNVFQRVLASITISSKMIFKLPKASMSTSTRTIENRWKPLKTVVTRWNEVDTYTKEVNQAQHTSLQRFSTLFNASSPQYLSRAKWPLNCQKLVWVQVQERLKTVKNRWKPL